MRRCSTFRSERRTVHDISRYTNGYNVIIYGLIPRDRGDPGRGDGWPRPIPPKFRDKLRFTGRRFRRCGRRITRRTVSASRTRARPARLTLFEYFKADPNYVVIYDGSLWPDRGRAMHGRVVYLNIRSRPVYMRIYIRIYMFQFPPPRPFSEQPSSTTPSPPPPKSCSGYNESARGRRRQRRRWWW